MKITAMPLTQTFQLMSDPDGKAEVTIRQAREGENIERAQMFARTRYVQEADTTAAEQDVNPRRLRRKEAYLVLGRVTGIMDEHDRELFRSKEGDEGASIRAAMSETEFNRVWDRLPAEMAAEISRYVFDVNPTWDPNRGE